MGKHHRLQQDSSETVEFGQLTPEGAEQAAQQTGNAELLERFYGGRAEGGDRAEGDALDLSAPPEVLAADALRQGMMGQPVALPYRKELEGQLGQSLGALRCFTGPEAEVACAAVQAMAFAVGDVIVLSSPNLPFEVVQHEVLHALQQGMRAAPEDAERLAMGRPGDAAEQEVHTAAGEQLGEIAQGAMQPKLSGFFYLSGCTTESNSTESSTTGTKGIPDTNDGWLLVKLDSGEVVSLPSRLKVEQTGSSDGRDQFKILEGIHEGETASVAQKSGGGSHLNAGTSWSGATNATFDKTAGTLEVGGSTYTSQTHPDNEIPDGDHVINIPDFPHDLGAGYHAKGTVWFRLGTSGDRYLHPGRFSEGCVTVTDTGNWGKIYDSLIGSRQDSKNVGTLKVKS